MQPPGNPACKPSDEFWSPTILPSIHQLIRPFGHPTYSLAHLTIWLPDHWAILLLFVNNHLVIWPSGHLTKSGKQVCGNPINWLSHLEIWPFSHLAISQSANTATRLLDLIKISFCKQGMPSKLSALEHRNRPTPQNIDTCRTLWMKN